MRKIKFLTLAALCLCVWLPSWADQTTQGHDFWVTFMRADQDANNTLTLSLSISSQDACEVTISNPYTNYTETVHVNAQEKKLVDLYYQGSAIASDARQTMEQSGKVCYAVNSEQVDTCALHVTATAEDGITPVDISLFATSYKKATFDATNVLPTSTLLDEYYIQCYSPSDKDGDSKSQGSHFAIIATEDSTVVDYVPTVLTENFPNDSILGATLTTPVLMKGQVFYVWTGMGVWKNADLSGTYVKARNGKPIAVFQGNPHTDVPYKVNQRDHLYSQAMPTQYWGTTFIPVASCNRKRDIFRIMALYDGTKVIINDSVMHVFDFTNGTEDDKKHFYEFELGDLTATTDRGGKGEVDVIGGNSCLVHTSCVSQLHQFITSQKYGDSKNTSGDPAMMWVNPVEQQIDKITFATYDSQNTEKEETHHYTNIVTKNPEGMKLNNSAMSVSEFKQVGTSGYYYTQHALGTVAASHTLENTKGQFIATVYGYTGNESYAYSAGGATKPVKQSVYINGIEFKKGDKTQELCGLDTISFNVKIDATTEWVKWAFFTDSTYSKPVLDTTVTAQDTVKYLFPKGGTYPGYCLIHFPETDDCGSLMSGLSNKDTIWITVNTQGVKVKLNELPATCADQGQTLLDESSFDMTVGNMNPDIIVVTLDPDEKGLISDEPHTFTALKEVSIALPKDLPMGDYTGTVYFYTTNCGSDSTSFTYHVNYPLSVIQQRWGDVLGITNEDAQLLSNPTNYYNLNGAKFQWYKNGVAIKGATTNVLNQALDTTAEYTVEITHRGVSSFSCPFKPSSYTGSSQIVDDIQFWAQPDGQTFVKTPAKGHLTLRHTSGKTVNTQEVNAGVSCLQLPSELGLYILQVQTEDGQTKSFKVLVK